MYSDEHLWKYADGELSPTEAAALEAASTGDDGLRSRIGEIRLIKAEVLGDAPAPPEGFAARVAAQALWRRRTPTLDLDEARQFLRRVLVAATILAAVGLVYLAVEVVPTLLQPPEMYAIPELGP